MKSNRTKTVQQNGCVQDKESLVIIGNGMATGRLLDEILKRSPEKYQITVIGAESQGSYNRIMLSSALAGEVEYEEIIQKTKSWYDEQNISLISSAFATAINADEKTVMLDGNSDHLVTYEQLILAVGSRSAKIPSENQEIAGIFSFRSIDDTQQIETYATRNVQQGNKKALVIGGGLLGLEAAYGLATRGIKVTLVHRNSWLLNRQLDKTSGKLLQQVMEQKNIEFILGQEVVRFNDEINAENIASLCSVELTNGQTLEVGMAVIATGITPNSELAVSAKLEANKAIVVDDYMQTSNEFISALGECCEHKNATFGLVDPIWNQCEVLAERLANEVRKPFENLPVPTKLKVSGIQLFSAGVVECSDTTESYILLDKKAFVYRKLIVSNGLIVGIVLFGNVSSGIEYFELMKNKKNILNFLPELIIGSEFVTLNSEVEAIQ